MQALSIIRKMIVLLIFTAVSIHAISLDSLKERIIAKFDLLPEYNLAFDMSSYMLHQNSFQKRNYLAAPHPKLQFCFLSYKDRIASVWDADFQFGLGELPDNVVFTVLDIQFGIEPAIRVMLKNNYIDAGIAHRCIHEIDRKEFPIVHFNRLFIDGCSKNYELSDYWGTLRNDTSLSFKNRFAWDSELSYYLREFFGIVSTNKLNGNNPYVWDISCRFRYSVFRTRSWIFEINSESKLGIYDPAADFIAQKNTNWYGEQITGLKAFFSRGYRGACFYTDYHLDKLPVPVNQPSVAQGKSRFSKNGMIQFGLIFFN